MIINDNSQKSKLDFYTGTDLIHTNNFAYKTIENFDGCYIERFPHK